MKSLKNVKPKNIKLKKTFKKLDVRMVSSFLGNLLTPQYSKYVLRALLKFEMIYYA